MSLGKAPDTGPEWGPWWPLSVVVGGFGHAAATVSLLVRWGYFVVGDDGHQVDLSVTSWQLGAWPGVYLIGLIVVEILLVAALWGTWSVNVPARIAGVGVASLLLVALGVAGGDDGGLLHPGEASEQIAAVAAGPTWAMWAVGLLGVALLLAWRPRSTYQEVTGGVTANAGTAGRRPRR